LFKRRASSLEPLDGLRAIAALWVMAEHTLLNGNHRFFGLPLKTPILRAIVNGDIAVDVFFVLSGFLIAFILLKECKREGGISLFAFWRGRFVRIWPALLVYVLFAFPWQKKFVRNGGYHDAFLSNKLV